MKKKLESFSEVIFNFKEKQVTLINSVISLIYGNVDKINTYDVTTGGKEITKQTINASGAND